MGGMMETSGCSRRLKAPRCDSLRITAYLKVRFVAPDCPSVGEGTRRLFSRALGWWARRRDTVVVLRQGLLVFGRRRVIGSCLACCRYRCVQWRETSTRKGLIRRLEYKLVRSRGGCQALEGAKRDEMLRRGRRECLDEGARDLCLCASAGS